MPEHSSCQQASRLRDDETQAEQRREEEEEGKRQEEEEEGKAAGRLTVAFSALMLWARGKPMDVRMETLSSGGELGSSGVAPMTLSLVEGPESIMEGRVSGSAKSEEDMKHSFYI